MVILKVAQNCLIIFELLERALNCIGCCLALSCKILIMLSFAFVYDGVCLLEWIKLIRSIDSVATQRGGWPSLKTCSVLC